jgi:pyruvate dehydrogenase E2 component (dihydrolipoamide acetyltransferase)
MAYVVKLPKLGLEMEEGTILEWYVEEDEAVAEGEVLLEVESEKSIGEVEAREDGVLRLLAVGEDETVPPGAPIGIVADPGEDIDALRAEFDSGNEGSEDGEEMATDADTTNGDSATHSTDDGTRSESSTADVRASPRAKRRAEEVGVGLAGIDGTGPQGAITAEDVDSAAEVTASETEVEAETSTGTGSDTAAGQIRASPRARDRAADLGVDLTAVEGTGPRDAITEVDVETAAEADAEPSPVGDPTTDGQAAASDSGETVGSVDRYRSTTLVTDGMEADALLEARGLASEAFGLDISVLDVLLVAVSATLPSHPSLNATFEDGTHHLHGHQRVALGTGEGSPTITVDDVAEQSFADLVAVRQDRSGDSENDTNSGSGNAEAPVTFALAAGDNLEEVLEAPTVAGLAIDVSKRRAIPVEEGEGVSLERYLLCSISYDPRAVGNANVRAFLDGVLDAIERAPELILRTYR